MRIARTMMRSVLGRHAFGVACVAAVLGVAAPAFAGDPVGALDELKRGYALKQDGKCVAAIPHFVESNRLDPQPKALLNLADCEEQLGDLLGAQRHAIGARELARKQENAELLAVAEERLAALDRRIPRLTIRLASDASSTAIVVLDGVVVAPVSLGVAFATNPGDHVVLVRAFGRSEKRFAMKLAEGATQDLEVGPGAPLDSTPEPIASASSAWSTRRWAAVTLGAAGVIGIGVGAFFGLRAIGEKNDSNANGHCDGGCDATGVKLRNDARSDATISTVTIVIGLAALAGGVALFVTEPSDRSTQGVRIHVTPSIARDGATMMLRGAW